jgi:TRAP-type mannitol/chloroaromatic compound transport system substrate-binding protein
MTKKIINRRSFLKSASAVGAAGLLTACGSEGSSEDEKSSASSNGGAPAVNLKKRNLTMVTTWPKNFPGMGVGAERYAQRISDMTDGRINIKVYAGGELVPALGAFDAVSSGKADIYHGPEYYWQGKAKAFNFFTTVPMGMTADEMAAWIYQDGGQELWDELSAPFNIKAFLGGTTGTQMGGWFRNPINSIKDFENLRIRMPGLGGEVMSRMGATPVTKAGGEIYTALSQGNIDATEWVGPYNDLAFGFYEIAKYYYYPGLHEPGTAMAIGFNKDVFESFSKADQLLLQVACEAEYTVMYADFNANNGRALDTLINEHGVKLLKFSDDILEAFGKISIEVIDDIAKEDELTGRIVASYKDSLARTSKWGEIGERAFTRARALQQQFDL